MFFNKNIHRDLGGSMDSNTYRSASVSIYKPTRLYIKRHSVTGLRYFGKTVRKDVGKYTGSGKHWKNHINKHGKEYIVTEWVSGWFYEKEEIKSFALSFSEIFDIVDSDVWANMMAEDGLTGNGSPGRRVSDETRKKISLSNTGKICPPEINKKKGRTGSDNGMHGVRRFGKNSPHYGIPHSVEAKLLISNKAKLRARIKCPHCNTAGQSSNMIRWHFNNCSQSPTFDHIKYLERKIIGRVCRISDKKEFDAGNWAKYIKSLII